VTLHAGDMGYTIGHFAMLAKALSHAEYRSHRMTSDGATESLFVPVLD
jgi:hypothetical protein